MTTPKTTAGRALLRYLDADGYTGAAAEMLEVESRIAAIEAEARAAADRQLAALVAIAERGIRARSYTAAASARREVHKAGLKWALAERDIARAEAEVSDQAHAQLVHDYNTLAAENAALRKWIDRLRGFIAAGERLTPELLDELKELLAATAVRVSSDSFIHPSVRLNENTPDLLHDR